MLTEKQYLAKHKTKFDSQKLSQAQRRARYRVYTRQQSSQLQTTPRSRASLAPMLKMSECAEAYAHALIDPFAAPDPPCIPDNISIPSYKSRSFAKGVFTAGIGGVAAISMDPWLFGTTQVSAYVTNTAYPSGSYVNPTVTPTGWTAITSTGIVTPTAVSNNDVEGRLVAAGIRVRYIGPELNRAGLVVKYRDPGNLMIASHPTDALLLFQEASTSPVDRKWHYVMYRPARASDLYYTATPLSGTPQPSLLVYVAGCTPGTSFEYEAVAHHEFTGRALPGITPSFVDPNGMAIVQSALGANMPTSSPSATWEAFKAKAFEVAQHTLTQVATNVVGSMMPMRSTVPLITDL